MFSFRVAFGIAVALVTIAALNRHFSVGYLALVILYLILASFVPWLMVPLGIVIVIVEVLDSKGGIFGWIASFKGQ